MVEKITNKTPHSVYLLNLDHTIRRVFPKSTGMIRVKEIVKDVEPIDGIPVSSTSWGETSDVPPYVENQYYIVSQLVKNALPYRQDLLVPKGVVRNEEGTIIGCTRLDIGSSNNN